MAGIAGAGNWIVDQIKIIDTWPRVGELVNIIGEDTGGGGAPFNTIRDIARAGVDFPLYGLGCIGNDEGGAYVRQQCGEHGIDTDFLVTLDDGTPTSFTDVMTIQGTGERTFFHSRGANARFSPEHVPVEKLAAVDVSIFHFGYLLLLDAMDSEDEEYGIVAARLLAEVKKAGMETSVDVVSESSDRFRKVVLPVLPYVDHCIINEVEAQKITGKEIRKNGGIDGEILAAAAADILGQGVGRTVVIHFPEGALWMDSEGNTIRKTAYDLEGVSIVSTVGAGDAFCAGVLIGLHEKWPPEDCLAAGTDLACACLFANDTVSGVGKLEDVRKRNREQFTFRESF
jgi:sugar/nucleoside kinase (ribokinase family)